MTAQDLTQYTWENRLVLVETPEFHNEKALEQLTLLKQESPKFKKYRLLVVERSNEGFRKSFGPVTMHSLEDPITDFKIYLIGLDGGIKFKSTEVTEVQKFFDLISSMPMFKEDK